MKSLVLAGSCPQIILLNQLRERGIYTILADNNINAVARDYADDFVKVDILDCEAVEKIALEKKVSSFSGSGDAGDRCDGGDGGSARSGQIPGTGSFQFSGMDGGGYLASLRQKRMGSADSI